MAALSGKKVVAGALGAVAILGLCSCSAVPPDVDPSASGPTTSVEQTVSPSPSAAPSGYVNPGTLDFPAETDAGYVFSDVPQSDSEQYIADTYPDLWAQGVRALSPKMVPGYNYADPATHGALIQYIDGVRYEGTASEPLGFRGQISDPQSLPSDTVANVITGMNGDGSWPAGNTGQGGYTIAINERDPKGTALEVYQFINASTTKKLGSTMYFDGWEEAWAYAQANGYSVPGMDRELNPGEVSSITALHYTKGLTAMSAWVWDSSINDWALVGAFD